MVAGLISPKGSRWVYIHPKVWGYIWGYEDRDTPTMPLTDTACRNAKGREKPYKLSDGHGLYLFVSPNGSRLWRQKYRHGGKEKTLSFGAYPVVGIAEARAKSANARHALQDGLDPSRKSPDGARVADTFESVAREWLDNMDHTWSPGHAQRVRARFEGDVFPHIGKRAITDIEAPDVLDLLRKVEARGAIEMAKRVRQPIGQVFRYAIATGRARRDPTPDLRGALKPSPRVRHQAKLAAKDLPEFLTRLRAYDGEVTALALELLIHTWLRTGEVRLGTWDEIDGDIWRIPAERMKMSRDHLVPLTPQVQKILARLKALSNGSAYIAPGFNGGTMSANTLIYAIYRMGYHSRATVHGFRGTASTICNESGLFRGDVIERQLAHAPGDEVRAAYNAAEYLPERRAMLEWWSDYLESAEAT